MGDLTAKWDVVVHTFIGDQTAFHELKAEGNTVSGTVTDKANGAQADIVNGKFDGKKFSYEFKIKVPIGLIDCSIEGELLDENTIKGESTNPMGTFNFEGKRL
jgi:hypothetical protein